MRLTTLFLLSFVSLPAAQLVANGGFENLLSTTTSPYPTGIGNAANWVSAGGSPDFYSNASMIFFGNTTAQTCFAGNACAGILNAPPASNNNNSVQYEYLQTELLSSMVAGETYQISLMAAFSDRYRVVTPDFGFHLSTGTSINRPTGASFLPITLSPTHNNPTGTFITSTAWLPYQTQYVATGGERYLTIGNFIQSPSFFLPTFTGPNVSSGYFFVDNVSVIGPDPAGVPEPGTLATVVAGLAAVAYRARRRS
jgi:PEP-CTERM motif